MADVVADMASDIPALFESSEYQNQRLAFEQEFASARDETISTLAKEAEGEGVALMQSQNGLMLGVIIDGKVAEPDVLGKLPAKEQKAIQEKLKGWQMKLAEELKDVPKGERQMRKRLDQLNRQSVEAVVEARLAEVPKALVKIDGVKAHLGKVQEDMVKYFEIFMQANAMATGAGAGSRVALGVTVFFGMILATVLGLVLTPSLYRMIQGLAERFGGGNVSSGDAVAPKESGSLEGGSDQGDGGDEEGSVATGQ